MRVIISAREKSASTGTEYLPAEQFELNARLEWAGGDGSSRNPKRLQITVQNCATDAWSGVIRIELCRKMQKTKVFMPGFMYGRNRAEAPLTTPRKFPRIRKGEPSLPASPFWMVRGDRLSNPSAFLYDGGAILGFGAAPYWVKDGEIKKEWSANSTLQADAFYQYAGYCCDIEKVIDGETYAAVGYTLGYENAPWLFVQSLTIHDRAPLSDTNCFVLEAGEKVSFELRVYDYASEKEAGVQEAIEHEYTLIHQAPRRLEGMSLRKATKDIATAIADAAWIEEEAAYSGFVFEQPDGSHTYNYLGSLSWTNGLSVAVPMLLSGLRLQDERIRGQAVKAIQNIVEHCINPASGLPYDAVQHGNWNLNGWWYDIMYIGGHSGYIVGQALYYILKAYDYEKRLKGIEHTDWLALVKPVIGRLQKTKNGEAEYPFVLSEETGAGIAYDSLGGCWCLAASAYYSVLTGDKSLVEGMQDSEQGYYEKYIKRFEAYGGPLDVDRAVDSEGNLAYIRAVRYLHMLTGEEKYLLHMKDAIGYELSFKFAYNSPVKIPPLSRVGWSSCGGTITSTANPHIHPMSSTIVDELWYYVKQTGDKYVEERLRDTVFWGCQSYNTVDKEYDYGQVGWMSERFCYSEGLVTEKYPDGSSASTWFALMPWASASILEGMAGEYWEEENGSSKES